MDTEQQLKLCKAMFGKIRKARGVFYWTQDEHLINITNATVVFSATYSRHDVLCKKDFVLIRKQLNQGQYTAGSDYAVDIYSITGKYLIRLENTKYNEHKNLHDIHLENGIILLHNIVQGIEKQNKRILVYSKKQDSIVYIVRNIESFFNYNDHIYLAFTETDEQGNSRIRTLKLYKKQDW